VKHSDEHEAELECDLLVAGSGAGALVAALAAAHQGLDVIVAEKEDVFGGTSAYSGGWLWVPNNRLAQEAGIEDSAEQALAYLRHETGQYFNQECAEAYVRTAPEMMEFVENNSPVQFTLYVELPDYRPNSPGAHQGGRTVYTRVWDGRQLGKDLDRLRRSHKSMTVGGMQIANEDIRTFVTSGRRLSSFFGVVKLLAGNAFNLVRFGQTTRLGNGRALVGGLAAAAIARGVKLWTSSPVRCLLSENGEVTGAVVRHRGKDLAIRSRRGVILATGGFPHDSRRRNQVVGDIMNDCATNSVAWGLMPRGNTGDGLRMAEQVGGKYDARVVDPIAYVPFSQTTSAEGDYGIFPAFLHRGVPGQICVTSDGKRFVSEGTSYHDWGAALIRKSGSEAETAAWFVCDARTLKKYGLLAVPPAPSPHGSFVRSGYLKKGETVRELAEVAGINPDGLEVAVNRFNADMAKGHDPDFGRGESPYEVINGDPDHKPNANLGALDKGPYFAVKVTVGCAATHPGLAINRNAQVLKNDGTAIRGLYAVGTDAVSVSGGIVLAGGITIGPAMTFGYLAARHAISGEVR